MSIQIICPACSARLAAPEHLAGKHVSCSQCHARLTVPLLELEEAAPPPTPAVVREIRRSRDDDDGDRDQRDSRGKRFSCPFCQTEGPPETVSKISTVGWVVFVCLLLFCFPLCFIGLLIKEEQRKCRTCGTKLG